jgi:endonuclease YncB( thermonuclease family)
MQFYRSAPSLPSTIQLAPIWRRRPIACAAVAGLTVLAWFGRSHPPLSADHRVYHNRDFAVAHVIDGDTLDVAYPDGSSATTRVRLWGVDAPELPGPAGAMHFGSQAAAFARDALEGRRVRLRLADGPTRDKFNRLLAYAALADTGESFNEMLLSRGFAYADWRFPHPLLPLYRSIEADARMSRTGLWANVRSIDMPPWRQRMQPRQP